MLDMTVQMGRNVPTAEQVLSVIRGELRLVRAIHNGTLDAMRAEWIEHDEDYNLTDGNDLAADAAVFQALRDSAMTSVRQWAADTELVFDKERVGEFIRQSLIAAVDPQQLPSDALDY